MKSKTRRFGSLLALLFSCSAMLWAAANDLQPATSEAVARGKTVFHSACAPCHGTDGKGHGILAANLSTKPRDLTRGVYKNRSTPSGTLPTNADLYGTLTTGIHSTSMPAFRLMPSDDRRAVVEYIKTLSSRFADPDEYPLEPVAIHSVPTATPDRIGKGSTVYATMKCADCHGRTGKADVDSAAKQVDDLGQTVRTPDLTNSAAYKFSRSATDVYRILSTGLDGVPMPSYVSTMSEEDRWHLAFFIWAMQSGF